MIQMVEVFAKPEFFGKEPVKIVIPYAGAAPLAFRPNGRGRVSPDVLLATDWLEAFNPEIETALVIEPKPESSEIQLETPKPRSKKPK